MRDCRSKRGLIFALSVGRIVFLSGRKSSFSIWQSFQYFCENEFFYPQYVIFCPNLKKSAFKNAPILSFSGFVHSCVALKG